MLPFFFVFDFLPSSFDLLLSSPLASVPPRSSSSYSRHALLYLDLSCHRLGTCIPRTPSESYLPSPRYVTIIQKQLLKT